MTLEGLIILFVALGATGSMVRYVIGPCSPSQYLTRESRDYPGYPFLPPPEHDWHTAWDDGDTGPAPGLWMT